MARRSAHIVLAVLEANTHSWVTRSDIAIWVYGNDDALSVKRVSESMIRLRRKGYVIVSRYAPWTFSRARAYRLVRVHARAA